MHREQTGLGTCCAILSVATACNEKWDTLLPIQLNLFPDTTKALSGIPKMA